MKQLFRLTTFYCGPFVIVNNANADVNQYNIAITNTNSFINIVTHIYQLQNIIQKIIKIILL